MQREFDVVDGISPVEHLNTYYGVPVVQGCTTQPFFKDEFFNLDFQIGTETGMIQIGKLLPLDVIYNQTHNPGTVGSLWKNHHSQFYSFIKDQGSKNVLEIGGGHGILSSYADIDWTIIDPLTCKELNPNVKVINEFFTENTVIPESIDTIVHSHFLEHVYEPSKIFKLFGSIKPGTKMVFSIPVLDKHFLDFKYLSALSFEHTYMCSEEYVEYWLAKNGFFILEKQVYGNYHSMFYSVLKTSNKEYPFTKPDNYKKNKQKASEFFSYYNDEIDSLTCQIRNADAPCYIFSAHVHSQFLLTQGIDFDKKLISVLDNDPLKQGKRLYGTQLFVDPPSILNKHHSPIVILKVGAYSEEIKEDILRNINPNTRFIE